MEKFVVIMAGGVGSRFWPRSRKLKPKQLLNIFGDNTMIQNTVERLEGFVDKDKILVITNKVQKTLIEEQLPEIPKDNIVAEPVGRNTAPCVGLSALLASQTAEDSVIITLPADHLINDKEIFIEALKKGSDFAYKNKSLITFGIKPTRPDTGYGYINFKDAEVDSGIHEVIKFVEKPNLETAEKYLASGDYFWNSGMFIWRADVILEEFKKYKVNIYDDLQKLKSGIDKNDFQNTIEKVYPEMENISIDYAIMENSDKVFVLKGDFDWSDVGSWETVYELSEKDENNNALQGNVFTKETKNSYIHSPNKFTAVIGEDNLVVIDTDDALLICNRNNVQDVKDVVKFLEENDTSLI